MFTLRFQLGYVVAMLAVFAAVAFFTRAGPRRIAGAACSVLVFTALSSPIDNLGHDQGWWSYPSCIDPPHPPLLVYIGQALAFVGCLALIAWRVQRRYGARGIVILAALVCGGGFVRDFSVAFVLPDVIRFGEPPASIVSDVVAWAVVFAVAFVVTRVVAGPATADALRARRSTRAA